MPGLRGTPAGRKIICAPTNKWRPLCTWSCRVCGALLREWHQSVPQLISDFPSVPGHAGFAEHSSGNDNNLFPNYLVAFNLYLVMPGLRGTPAGMTTICAPTREASSWSAPTNPVVSAWIEVHIFKFITITARLHRITIQLWIISVVGWDTVDQDNTDVLNFRMSRIPELFYFVFTLVSTWERSAATPGVWTIS